MASLTEPVSVFFEPDTELVDRDPQPFSVDLIRASKIVTTVTHARYGKFDGKVACLLVLRCDFVPDFKIRFKFAEVTLKIVKGGGSSIIAYRPHTWKGMAAGRQVRVDSVANGTLEGFDGGENAGPDTRFKQGLEHSGNKRIGFNRAQIFSVLENSAVTWRLSENDVKREGIPNPFTVALIVETDGNFSIRTNYQVSLSQSADPRSPRPAFARLTQPLELSQNSIGSGKGPLVANIEEMEQDSFNLDTFAPTQWIL